MFQFYIKTTQAYYKIEYRYVNMNDEMIQDICDYIKDNEDVILEKLEDMLNGLLNRKV